MTIQLSHACVLDALRHAMLVTRNTCVKAQTLLEL